MKCELLCHPSTGRSGEREEKHQRKCQCTQGRTGLANIVVYMSNASGKQIRLFLTGNLGILISWDLQRPHCCHCWRCRNGTTVFPGYGRQKIKLPPESVSFERSSRKVFHQTSTWAFTSYCWVDWRSLWLIWRGINSVWAGSVCLQGDRAHGYRNSYTNRRGLLCLTNSATGLAKK